MPTYDYACSCGHVQEEYRTMTDDSPVLCEKCGGDMTRLISAGLPPKIRGTKTPYRGT